MARRQDCQQSSCTCDSCRDCCLSHSHTQELYWPIESSNTISLILTSASAQPKLDTGCEAVSDRRFVCKSAATWPNFSLPAARSHLSSFFTAGLFVSSFRLNVRVRHKTELAIYVSMVCFKARLDRLLASAQQVSLFRSISISLPSGV